MKWLVLIGVLVALRGAAQNDSINGMDINEIESLLIGKWQYVQDSSFIVTDYIIEYKKNKKYEAVIRGSIRKGKWKLKDSNITDMMAFLIIPKKVADATDTRAIVKLDKEWLIVLSCTCNLAEPYDKDRT